jgi:very-short-patch-repair endonuclease
MRSNPTEAERRLWSILRGKRLAAYKFKRQQVIGNYIVDFVNFERRVIVEADGSQHAESAYDLNRDAWLRAQGFTITRFWNNDILARTEQVANALWHALQPQHTPLPNPSPARGEGLVHGADIVRPI